MVQPNYRQLVHWAKLCLSMEERGIKTLKAYHVIKLQILHQKSRE